MKVLPRKSDVDKLLTAERKAAIDQGIELTGQIETLRRMKDDEESSLLAFRNNALKTVQSEIDELLAEREQLEREVSEKRLEREQLIAPLDDEWKKIADERVKVREMLRNAENDSISAKNSRIESENTRIEAEKHLSEAKRQSDIASKLLSEAMELKKETENDRNDAVLDKIANQEQYQNAISEIEFMISSYENGIALNNRESLELRKREKELNNRERFINDKYATLQRAMKRHGQRI